VNVLGVVRTVQALLPALRERRGHVVLTGSTAGRWVYEGGASYTAAKHALVGLTRQLSHELGPYGITVNAVAPGLVLSNPTTQRQWDGYGAEGQRRLLEGLHTRRLVGAQDIAHAVLFLASEQAGAITGQVLSVDGGRS